MENDAAHYVSIWAAFISPLQQADKKVTFSNGKTNGLFYNEVPIIFQYRVPFLFRRMKCGTTCDKKRISDILLCAQCTLKTRLRCVKKRYHKKTLSK